jgi:hypothetical protein
MPTWQKGTRFDDVSDVIAAIRNGHSIYWGAKLRNSKSMLDESLRVLIVATAMGELWSAEKEEE